jgi:hypothetical protein
MAAYGIDTLDPAVTPRRVMVLARGLPPRFRNTGEQWSTEAHLLAHLADRVAELTWITMRAHGAKNVARPKPVPRPPQRGGARPQRAQAAPEPRQPGEVKHGSWADAIMAMAGMPGVKVEHHGE